MELLNFEKATPATYQPPQPGKEKNFIESITSVITDNWFYIVLAGGAALAIYLYMNKSGGGGRKRR